MADRAYLREAIRHGGQFVVRAQTGINPVIDAVHSGVRGAKVIGRKLKDVPRHLSKEYPNDMTVSWPVNGESLTCRLVLLWAPQCREFIHPVTNLPVARYDAFAVGQVYKLRWQIELLFKEWKSHANLRAFSTANASIVEGLI